MPDFCSLEGKTALVTGGSRGIGAAIARELAEAGATVTLSYRSGKEEAETVARETGARAVQADVRNPEEAKALVDEAGDLDILVNNAGVTRDGLIARMSDDDLRRDCEHLVRRRAARQSWADELLRIEGGNHRLHQGVGARARHPRRACKCRRTGVCRDAADGGDLGRDAGLDAGEYPARPSRQAGGRGRRGTVPVLTEFIEYKQARRMDRFAQMIVAAARQAEADSGIDVASEGDRIGASIATGIGGLQSYQDCYDTLLARGPDRVNPFAIPAIIPNMGAGWVSMELGTRGPLASQCTACAASNMAIGDGTDQIRLGRADMMLCGGTEAAVNEIGIAGFGAMRALSRRNDDPKRASRPFDAERDGFVMGEAAAVVVLEELEHARARGAKIYAELAGYGLSSDARHVTEPDPTGENPARAMRYAFRDAGIEPSEIDYINAHGTSTPLGDASETRVIKKALGEEDARKTPVSSTKGATGHCLGAAGAVEAMFSILAIRDGKLPPTINQEVEDPACDLDYIPNESRDADVRIAVSNSFGFGGHNACRAGGGRHAELPRGDDRGDARARRFR